MCGDRFLGKDQLCPREQNSYALHPGLPFLALISPLQRVGTHSYVQEDARQLRDRSNLPPPASGFHSQELGPGKVVRVLNQQDTHPPVKQPRDLDDLNPAPFSQF